MRESDLDDNDPLSIYLKKILSAEASKMTATRSSQSMSLSRDMKTDSISDITRRRSENINHSEIDTENEKVEEKDVSKQTD